jgi:hypothetical protein
MDSPLLVGVNKTPSEQDERHNQTLPFEAESQLAF